ncbi:MAG: pilin [Burkholderiales bacterium]|nr:pilin [Burkholderiales bacterium]
MNGSPHEPVKKPRSVPWTALISIVILGALVAAVLIPSYGNYADRSQVAEAISLLGGARTPLAEYYAGHKKWPQSLAGMIPEPGGKYVQSVAITKGAGIAGEIELSATLKTEGVDRRVAGKSVRLLSADGGKSWTCRAGTVPEKTLPQSCRASQ